MMLMAASWPSKSAAAVTNRTLWVGRNGAEEAESVGAVVGVVMVALSCPDMGKWASVSRCGPGEGARLGDSVARIRAWEPVMSQERFSDEDLARLVAGGESDLVEFKESLAGDSLRKVRHAITAFANSLRGGRTPGVVVIGIKDDGSPAGLVVDDELLRRLSDIRGDGQITPPPSMTVERRSVLGAWVAVVTVAPSQSPPVKCDGRILVRVGPTTRLANDQDEIVLNERRRQSSSPADVQPVFAARIGDLDLDYFRQVYLPVAFAPEVLEANQRTVEQQLTATKMISSVDEQVPTLLGLLTIGKDPQWHVPGAYVQFLRVLGTTMTGDNFGDEAVFRGKLKDMIGATEAKLAAHNMHRVNVVAGPLEKRSFQYPPGALSQIFRNAIMHRSYEGTHAPVRVTWFDDRIEVHNPGGGFGGITQENFGEPGRAEYRNPNLAEAMRQLNLAQRFGYGLQAAKLELAKNGNPPMEYRLDAFTTVTLRPAPPPS